MFLDFKVSCEQMKIKAEEKLTITKWPQQIGRMDC